ncbi:hypothetical protein ZIOFF_006639 [Zingiber officinale]|uniref:Ribosomal protein L39 n=1 Tax=Zingiber officinale TaxID=94328 RepID=A0A8J5ID16_ZINOF|nr:hypothetical protein ZIOFF_006639 [Zingiber officinale]
MPSHKTFKIKQKLAKKMRQNRPIPHWIRLRTDNTIRPFTHAKGRSSSSSYSAFSCLLLNDNSFASNSKSDSRRHCYGPTAVQLAQAESNFRIAMIMCHPHEKRLTGDRWRCRCPTAVRVAQAKSNLCIAMILVAI